jgi:hypothetical protein
VRLTPEFELVAACCRWPADAAADERIRAAAQAVDWPLVAAVSARHRVDALVAHGLARAGVAVPDAVAGPLREGARRILIENLGLAAESARVRAGMEAAGVRPLFVKGVTLAALAYGSLAYKHGWDIDLLVAREQLEPAAAALDSAGYALILPKAPRSRERLAEWHAHWKESVWKHRESGVHVELHTSLYDHPAVLSEVGPHSPALEVEVAPGIRLPTLGRDALFAYLCVHGASSAWFRLKWIADLAALLGGASEEEVERLYRRSQALGAGRASAQGLLLARRLFGLDLPAALAAELERDRVNRWLLAVAMRKLAGRTVTREVTDTPLGTATIHLMQLGLLPGVRFKLSEIGRQLVRPQDRLAVALPRPLRFLYPAVSLVRRLQRKGA